MYESVYGPELDTKRNYFEGMLLVQLVLQGRMPRREMFTSDVSCTGARLTIPAELLGLYISR